MDPLVLLWKALCLAIRCMLGGQVFWPLVVFLLCVVYSEMLSLCRAYILGLVVHSLGVGYGGLRSFFRGYCVRLAQASVDHVVGCLTWAFCRWAVWLHLLQRKQRVRRVVSKRVSKVLEHLDFEGNETVEELIGQGSYIRASVVYSRQCRLALRYPKHSAANEMIAVDWLNKHLPEDMPFSVKFRIIPLAAKLAFVKSDREVRADEYFKMLAPLVETA